MRQRLRCWFADRRFQIEAFIVGFCRGFFTPLLAVWAVVGALVQVFNVAPEWCARHQKLWGIIALLLTFASLGFFAWAWRRRIGDIEDEHQTYQRQRRMAA